jgi:hypothetical protein
MALAGLLAWQARQLIHPWAVLLATVAVGAPIWFGLLRWKPVFFLGPMVPLLRERAQDSAVLRRLCRLLHLEVA